MAAPFHVASEDIRVDNGHILRARVAKGGEHVDAEIDLNTVLGNENGHFAWGGEGFALSAQNITFSIEGGASVPVLRAELRKVDGELVNADVNLAERIVNDDGRLVLA
ncbi:putative cyanovirin-n family protein [Diplogelasinospora grovesii]|uniref:Cyanovirin-n family protein n=1 Tax=Diplogelasinospora grovesii TaxID=303347 RepID=A0AAN6N5F6_9PEZI|nr:putative cyanovirin-n family protein [Diplogelasinospora grovesii]